MLLVRFTIVAFDKKNMCIEFMFEAGMVESHATVSVVIKKIKCFFFMKKNHRC